MTCGQANGSVSSATDQSSSDAFSFGQDLMGAQLSAMALVWTAPWRAASVVMGEAIRETNDRFR